MYHFYDFRKELHAVRAPVFLVGIGEVVSDVPLADGGEKGVHEGVDGNVAVAVRLQGAVGRNDGAAQRNVT